MPEIKLKTRIQNKYKILEEWDQLIKGDFIPLKGEVCYGIDENTLYQKVGDGKTDFVDLPWLLNQSDWLENDKTSPSYIQNRIAYTEVAEGDPILEIKYVNNDGISNPMIVQSNVAIICEGREFAEEDLGKLWSFNLTCTNTDGTNPLEIDIPGPVELKTFGEDDVIYYYGNFYRFYVLYAIMELQDEIAAGDITVEDIEQMVRDELQIEDTNENYAFVNMFGTIVGAMFGVVPDNPNNFNYEFSLSSYPTIVYKLDSKYLEEVNLVGKFQDMDSFSEIFNDYAYNRANGAYSHAEGYHNISNGKGSHTEGCENQTHGDGAHAEGSYTTASTGCHSEGYCTEAQGYVSHAEGYQTKASGRYSHSEGQNTLAYGEGSHVEGGTNYSFITDIQTQGYYIAEVGKITVNSSTKISALPYSLSNQNLIATVYCNNKNGVQKSFRVYTNSGNLYSGSIPEEWIEQGYIENVRIYVYSSDIGASGTYSHSEGLNNTAQGESSHAEGQKNLALGKNSHVGGSENTSLGDNSFVHGNNLIATKSNQIVLGGYNDPEDDSIFMIGNNLYSSTSRKNNLSLKQNGDLQIAGLVNDGETDVWRFVDSKKTGNLSQYYLFFEEDANPSKLINQGKIKIEINPKNYTYINNGNLLPKNWTQNTTLENGTTITLNDDLSITVDAKASTEEQIIPLCDWFNYDSYSGEYYCWDETADTEIYYGIKDSDGYHTNPGEHLIETPRNNRYNEDPHLNLHIVPGVEKIITLKSPVMTIATPPRRWVPIMDKIKISTKTTLELNLNEYPYNGQFGLIETGASYSQTTVKVYAIPKSVINEKRMEMILDDLKEEISTSLILKSPNGTKFNITVNDDGTLSATQI